MEIILLILFLAIYFLPTIIGWNKRNAVAIFMLNLLLGWTAIGWIVALIWSLTNDAPSKQIIYVDREPEKESLKKNHDKRMFTREELQKLLEEMPRDDKS